MTRASRTVALLVLALAASASAQAEPADERGLRVESAVTETELATMRSEPRVALVIGVADYEASPLKNTVNDARLMASALQAVGFEVIARDDVDRAGFYRALGEFERRVEARKGVALVYFAGHGVQAHGRNFLIPRDGFSGIRTQSDLDGYAIPLEHVLGAMRRSEPRVRIVLLDACRNNPIPAEVRDSARGLAGQRADGTVIGYATAEGQVVPDGRGDSGYYAAALAATLVRPGLTLEKVLKEVRAAVREASEDAQLPTYQSELEGEFYFVTPRQEEAVAKPAENTQGTGVPVTKPVVSGEPFSPAMARPPESNSARTPAAVVSSVGYYSATLEAGDVIEVRVAQSRELSGKYRVASDGTVDFPLVGAVRVAGKTASQVAGELRTALSAGYLANPTITVFVSQSADKKVYVLGEVNRSGTYSFDYDMTVVQAIILAGGLGASADANGAIVTRIENGAEKSFRVPVDKIYRGLAPNFTLMPGDIVFLPEGEVNLPKWVSKGRTRLCPG